MGTWVLVGGSVLGTCSLVLIIYSLWANSPRRQLRKQLMSGSYETGAYETLPQSSPRSAPAPAPPAPAPRARAAPPPPEKTVFMAAPVGPQRVEKTMFGPPPGPMIPSPPEPAPRTVIALSPDQRTQFLSLDDMFAGADARIEPTQILAADEVYGNDQPDDDETGEFAGFDPEADEDPTLELHDEQTMIVREEWQEPPKPVSATPRLPIPSRPLPGASLPQSRPVQAKPVASKPSSARLAPPDPSEFVKPVAARQPTPYVGYRDADEDDDDDDDDEVRPETEIVHQGELLRVMTKGKKP